MKTFAAAALIALASVASAQLDNIPSCALSCFLEPLQNDGCAELTDFACHCKKADTLLSSVTPCVQGACSPADQATVITAVEETCRAAGVPITVPTPGASSGVSPQPSATAEPSSQAPEPTSELTATPIPTGGNGASSVALSLSSALESAASSVAASVTPTASHTASGNGTTPVTHTPSQFTGAAAAQATKAAGVIGAAALALLAL